MKLGGKAKIYVDDPRSPLTDDDPRSHLTTQIVKQQLSPQLGKVFAVEYFA
jgi:hypothetical protein